MAGNSAGNAVSGSPGIRLLSQSPITSESQLPSTASARTNIQIYCGATFEDTVSGQTLESGNLYEWVNNQWQEISGGGSSSVTFATVSQINSGTGTATVISPANLYASNYQINLALATENIAGVQNISSACLLADTNVTLLEIPNICSIVYSATGYSQYNFILKNLYSSDISVSFLGESWIPYNEQNRSYLTTSGSVLSVELNSATYFGINGGQDANLQFDNDLIGTRLIITVRAGSTTYYINTEIYDSYGAAINCRGSYVSLGDITLNKKYSENLRDFIFAGVWPEMTIGDIIDDLTTQTTNQALSANQGYELNQLIANNPARGVLNGSGDISQLDNAQAGWQWVVTQSGTLTGDTTQTPLIAGYIVACTTTVSGTPTTLTSFSIIGDRNLDGSGNISQLYGARQGWSYNVTTGGTLTGDTSSTSLNVGDILVCNTTLISLPTNLSNFSINTSESTTNPFTFNNKIIADNSTDITIYNMGECTLIYDSTYQQFSIFNSGNTNSYQITYGQITQLGQSLPSFCNQVVYLSPGSTLYFTPQGNPTDNINTINYSAHGWFSLIDTINNVSYDAPILKNSAFYNSSSEIINNILEIYINQISLDLNKKGILHGIKR